MDGNVATVLQLGHPALRQVSSPVANVRDPAFLEGVRRLQATLEWFRQQHGFGRAIAAPQIGIRQRFIALNLGQAPFVVSNPEITWRSAERFTLWDDCMSFPGLLVRLERHVSISLRYLDEKGEVCVWDDLPQAQAELLQHEIDHLDGVLAVDRALDREAIITRATFEAMPDFFRAQVDDVIESPGS